MQYILLFLEGIITFISPCLLPMLPIYISYFAANEASKKKTLTNAIGFVCGFTIIFVLLGAFAGTLGRLLMEHSTALNIVTGVIVIIFGLNFLGVIKLNIFKGSRRNNIDTKNLGFFSAMLFGIVFSIGWTPCVGAFLGSALMLASNSGMVSTAILMLFVYSLGLGIPFILSAVLIDQLKGTLDFIKRNYTIINRISGGLLIIIGILMATGYLGYLLTFLTF